MSYPIKAVVFPAPGKVEIQEFVLPPPGDEDILVRSLYTMVSPGTELRMWSGQARFPMIPGYSTIGEVIEVGAKVKGYRVGDLVSGRSCKRFFADGTFNCGGHMSGQLFPTVGEDRAVLLPPSAKALDYVITEISSISLRGATAAVPRQGETAIVVGQGLIGAFSAAWLQACGCHVVVTNPTHIAVALRYDRKTMRAPTVVAKGIRLNAQKIRELAVQHQIPIMENKPLARMLFKHAKVGGEVPAHLYATAAEVLAWVYRINRYRYFSERNQA